MRPLTVLAFAFCAVAVLAAPEPFSKMLPRSWWGDTFGYLERPTDFEAYCIPYECSHACGKKEFQAYNDVLVRLPARSADLLHAKNDFSQTPEGQKAVRNAGFSGKGLSPEILSLSRQAYLV